MNDNELLKSKPVNILFGLIVVAVFGYFYYTASSREAALASDGVSAEGTIVSVRESRGRKGRIHYYPTIKFTDQSGQEQQFESPDAHSGSVGSTVKIKYSAANPSMGVIEGKVGSWFYIVIILGGLIYAGWNGYGFYRENAGGGSSGEEE